MFQLKTIVSLSGLTALLLTFIPLSSSSNENNASSIRFYLVSERGPSSVILLDLRHLHGNERYIKANSTWYFGFHGWGGTVTDTPLLPKMVKALKASENCNVVHVDWSYLAKPWYELAKRNVREVAEYVAETINIMSKNNLVGRMRVHLVGFSLGAQVVGFIGKYMTSKYNMKPSRITALDPAGPGYSDVEPSKRLDKEDAYYVQVIHTTGQSLGIWEPVGHVDFYLNGGKAPQPACLKKNSTIFSVIECSHQISKKIFAKSVQKNIYGIKCANWQEFVDGKCGGFKTRQTYCLLGLENEKCTEGIYNVTTFLASPNRI